MGNYYHRGGVVGRTPAPQKPVPVEIFEEAPRLHKGVAPDEFPAILQKGKQLSRKVKRWFQRMARR